MKIGQHTKYSSFDFVPCVVTKRLSLSNKFRFKLEKEDFIKKKGKKLLNEFVDTVNYQKNPAKGYVCLNSINVPQISNVKSKLFIPERINLTIQKLENQKSHKNVSRNENKPKFNIVSNTQTINYIQSNMKSIESDKNFNTIKLEKISSHLLESYRNRTNLPNDKMMQTVSCPISRSKSRYFPVYMNNDPIKMCEMKFEMIVKTEGLRMGKSLIKKRHVSSVF
jgi:hypothetical protein